MTKLLFYYNANPNYVDAYGEGLVGICIGQLKRHPNNKLKLEETRLMLRTLIDHGAPLIDVDYNTVCAHCPSAVLDEILASHSARGDLKSLTEILHSTSRLYDEVYLKSVVRFLTLMESHGSYVFADLKLIQFGQDVCEYYNECSIELTKSKTVRTNNESVYDLILGRSSLNWVRELTHKSPEISLTAEFTIYGIDVQVCLAKHQRSDSLIRKCSENLSKLGGIFSIRVVNKLYVDTLMTLIVKR
ncbi:hypothetical protein QAD02_008413 [Eretmocerus hayati]|uniref:Uncharacterized protein n=1 Tax=Eretmocerus hayati TaxID=131215 RepID=A0ACC2N785_9HYME|nr:hypothetical protein QAD02_008413 [Eretmocerus hayati]